MADLSLTAAGSLDGVVHAGRHGREGEAGVTASNLPPCRQTIVLAHRGKAEVLVAAAKERGIALPRPGRATVARDLTLVATGPGQWLALDGAFHTDLVGQLFKSLSANCSLVRANDGRTLIEVGGPSARRALGKMLTIDLHPRAFAPGSAAVTLAGTVAVTLWQIDDTPRYAIAVPRSMARSVWHWLVESAAEYGLLVAAGRAGEVAASGRSG